MNDWIKWLNPTAPITTEVDAVAAARASAVAIFLGVLWAIVGIAWMMTAGQAFMQEAMAQAAADAPEAAGMASAMTGVAMGMAIFFAVVQAAIGLVQWKWPNIFIPIIFALLVAYGLVMGLIGLVMTGDETMAAARAASPIWMTVLGLVILVIQLLWHINGVRGARALDKFKTGVV